jgi:regulator of protease activity HflC (stomatin/prohibitin superfamily)
MRTESSTSGIRAAQEVGAEKVPQAALHLQLAKEELERAKKLGADGDKEQGSSMLLRAQVDAELAVALSRESAERTEAQAAVGRVNQLLQENK